MAEPAKPDGKRRLPIHPEQSAPPDGEPDKPRPPWQWMLFGAVATFLGWIPLATFAEWLIRRLIDVEDARGRLTSAGLWLVAAHALAFCTASFLGGLLVGREGAPAGRREAALSGASAGALTWLLAASQSTPGGAIVWGPLLVMIALLGAASGYAGGRVGIRLRPKQNTG